MKDTKNSKNEQNTKNIKLVAMGLIIFLAISLLAMLVFGEETTTRFIVILALYIAALFYAMYSSLYLANTFSNKHTVFALVLIPRLIIFVLLSILVDHRMIFMDLIISYLVERTAQRLGETRNVVDQIRLATDETITNLGELPEDPKTAINKEGE